jgi:hypothetical protein
MSVTVFELDSQNKRFACPEVEFREGCDLGLRESYNWATGTVHGLKYFSWKRFQPANKMFVLV